MVTVVSSICLMCQFEYRRKKRLAWKSLPSSGYSTPTKQVKSVDCHRQVDTSTEDLLMSSPHLRPRRPPDVKRQQLKSTLKRASRLIKVHFKQVTRPSRPRVRRSLSEAHVIAAVDAMNYEMMPPSTMTLVTDKGVKKSLKVKSRRYRRGYTKALNRPQAPCSTPLSLAKRQRRWRSLADITDLLSSSVAPEEPDEVLAVAVVGPVYQELPEQPSCSEGTSQSRSLLSAGFEARGHRRRRLLSKSAKERLAEGRSRRMNSCATPLLSATASNDSLATLKPTTSMSEFSEHSYHSGDPELEFDLYDCDLNNVSTLPGSLFAPACSVGYYDLTPTETEEEFEMTELFPMLRQDADSNARKQTQSKCMVDSLTSDLAISITSEDLDHRTVYHTETATDNLLSKKPLLNLTHIDDEVSFVDE